MGRGIEQPVSESSTPTGIWPEFPREDFDRVRAGDTDAMGLFFDHYFPRVFATVYRLVGERALAEDITQNVFMKLQRTLVRVDGSRNLAPWLFTVCVNACRDHWRSSWWRMARNSVSLSDPSVVGSLRAESRDPEETALMRERAQRVQLALLQLSPPLRLAVVLHDCDGLPHEEVARITGISHAAARKRHSRALRVLAELLREKVDA